MAEARGEAGRLSASAIGWRRTGEMAAVFMIGDGVLGLVRPRGHVALWRSETRAVDAMVSAFAARPGRRRAYGLVQIAAGLALAAYVTRDTISRRV